MRHESEEKTDARTEVRSGSGRVKATLTVREDGAHLEVGGGEPDDGGLVQLAGDGRRERQQLGQLVELGILLLAARPGGIL